MKLEKIYFKFLEGRLKNTVRAVEPKPLKIASREKIRNLNLKIGTEGGNLLKRLIIELKKGLIINKLSSTSSNQSHHS